MKRNVIHSYIGKPEQWWVHNLSERIWTGHPGISGQIDAHILSDFVPWKRKKDI
jgi:hypothetical protein